MRMSFCGAGRALILLAAGVLSFSTMAIASAPPVGESQAQLTSCAPESEAIEAGADGMTLPFCAKWNPDFAGRGGMCCPKGPVAHKRRRGNHCGVARGKSTFCDEMTPAQRIYGDQASSGKLGDLLAFLTIEAGRRQVQSYCTVNYGFLVNGRMLVANSQNRVQIRAPDRCTNFGTDPMVAMLEWTGRQVNMQYSDPKFSKVRFLIGDVSAPRGGCLTGKSGRIGHASHTSGQDADIGFLTAKANQASPGSFHRKFDAKTNWWLLKRIFGNPFACVKVVFLDKRLIRQLPKAAAGDPEWLEYRKFIRHVRGHQNHMHVRIGNGPGKPGCGPDANPELESELEDEIQAATESPAFDSKADSDGDSDGLPSGGEPSPGPSPAVSSVPSAS